jgi:hypothetical protein
MNIQLKFIFILFLTIILVENSQAQITVPATSPSATLSQKIGLSDVKIIYSRPSARGRQIMGDLVPYGKIWRTGANEATKVSFSEEVTIEGKQLAAGEYGLFTIPEQDEWTVIFSNNTQLWGNQGYNDQDDAIRFKVKAHKNPNFVETFTINVADVTTAGAIFEIMWENTIVKFNVTSDVDSKVMAQIDRFSANPEASLANMYFQAATYYYVGMVGFPNFSCKFYGIYRSFRKISRA